MPRKAKPWFRAGRGWYVTMSDKQVPLGVTDPDASEEVVRAAFEQLVAAANQVSSNRGAQTRAPARIDWRAKAEEWYAHKAARKLKPKTIKGYKWNLSRWLDKFADLPPDRITADAVVEDSHARGWGDNQRRHYLMTAAMFCDWCGRPLGKVPIPAPKSAGAERLISEDLHNRAVKAAPPGMGPILQFMWHTGCRPCEAVGLTVDAVDWKNGVCRLREHKTAGKGKQRMLYLSKPALAVLEAQREKYPAGHLFRSGATGKPYPRTTISGQMTRIQEQLGERITAYGYRHSYATRALEAGIPDVQVAALLGHSSTQMIHAHYSHVGQNARLLKWVADRIDGEGAKAA